MRHYLSLLAGGIVLAAVFVGCTAEVENPEVDITSIRCSISQIDVEEDFATGILDTLSVTKATISGSSFLWSAGDRIGILPNTGSQIYFAVTNGAGTSSASFEGGDWAMKSTGTFYAYYPLYPDIFLTKDHVPVSYIGQTQSGNNNTLHTGEYWTLFTGGTTAVGNTLNFSFNHMTSFFKTYVTVPAGTYTKISFTAPSNIFIKEGYFDLSAQTPAIVGTTMTDELTLNLENVTFAEETELSGYLVVAPVDIAGVPITVTVFKDGVATYEYTLAKANNMVASKTYAFRATVLTQLASSVSQANTLFASGATAVTITEPLTADATVVLPDTGDAVTLTLPTTASSSKLTVSYDPGASSYPATLSITGPEGADLDIQTPSSTVTVNGVAYDQITSRTAANTCIIPAGVTVTTLKVIQGGVQVYGTVSQIDLSEQEDDAIINVSGTVASLIGEDDEEYVPATGVSLNKSSTNLNVGATETLTATVAPVGAYPKVIWSSSDEAVATVSSTGVVTAVTAGSATITAKTISGGLVSTCEISIAESNRPEGALSGLFSVGFNKKVYFSKGNLQARPWGFASKQYEIVGNTDANLYPEFEPGKVDLFCWSTDCRTNYTYGLSSDTNTGYYYGSFIEWGTKIDDNETWRTMSGDEWAYLLGTSSERLGKYKNWVSVNGINGLVIAPDEYSGTIANSYTEASWITAENEGLVFLPISGYRYNGYVVGISEYGYYWTSTSVSNIDARAVYIGPNFFGQDQNARRYASCVRLVSDCDTADPTPSPTLKNGHEYVDLGLPSGLKWATMNIGATNPKESGHKYAWGETSPKTDYTWDNYKYGRIDPSNTDYTQVSKYSTDGINTYSGTPDNKTVLEQEDDAAYVNWGEEWRMPLMDDWIELRTYCTWTWTTINSVKGYLVTGQNGNRIFLPLTGDTFSNEEAGIYWSSNLYTGSWDDSALIQFFNRSYYSNYSWNGWDRAEGCRIRPVTD